MLSLLAFPVLFLHNDGSGVALALVLGVARVGRAGVMRVIAVFVPAFVQAVVMAAFLHNHYLLI